MLKLKLSSLLFALLASMSLVVSAAEVSSKPASPGEAVQVATAAMVNLNTADAATLQRELLGIGQVKAEAIVAYREAHGNFASVDELLEVKGIGAAILEKNRDKLSIN
ncbi:ComEA family DNA-binding protein [Pseudomonas sp. EA_105y_Pfl2_R69]|jgi:competence protein ComEA|uniref:ComEA family DNA-binding protein n=1 Tax=Pseudomonas sp. EA_105y_Pfl2_R69 TaxID=3088683 RepID=UPI0030DDA70C